MTDFGSGFDLDQHLDLVVTPAGDISMVSGLDEVKKDLAYRLRAVLDDETGSVLTHDATERLTAVIEGVLLEDPRVDRVTSVSIEPSPRQHDTIAVTVEAETAEGPFDLGLSV